MTFHKRIKRNIPKLFQFGIVGSVGAVINLTVYFIASDIFHLNLNMSAISAFFVAVSNNYVLNHLWTFKDESNNYAVSFHKFTYYFFCNIFGLIINLVVLNIVVSYVGVNNHFFGQALGIFMGMLSNFIFAKKIVFNKNSSNKIYF
jgi:dolichol-phosphate mannosyltransferase